MSVTLIVVNYNNSEDTLRCLGSLVRLEESSQLSVIVVDNGSKDDSMAVISNVLDELPNSRLISLPENKGYAAGCNAGIQAVRRSSLAVSRSQFIWMLNNDTVLEPGALRALLDSANARPEVKIWGSTIREMDSAHAKTLSDSRKVAKDAEGTQHPLQCSGGFQYFPALSIPLPLKRDPGKHKGQTCVRDKRLSYISGVSMFVRADVFEKGLMDETYFLYYEELELVRLAGGKKYIAWCPESIIYHKGGGATGGADPNRGRGSYAAHYYGNRSALRYTWKYYKIYFPVVFVFRFVVKSVLFILYGEWKGFRPMVKGYVDFRTHP